MNQANDLEQLIATAEASGADCELRVFAVWCAMQTESSGTTWSHVIDLAEQYALGQVPYSDLEALRQSLAGTGAAAVTIGLRHKASNAATCMAALHTLKPDAADAARLAAEMHRRWALMRAEKQWATNERLTALETEILGQQIEQLKSMV